MLVINDLTIKFEVVFKIGLRVLYNLVINYFRFRYFHV